MDETRRYWGGIAFKALAIFGVGFLIWSLVRKGIDTGEALVTGAGPVTIPLPFIPFTVDGAKVGSLKSLTLVRLAPDQVDRVELAVKVDDSIATRLAASGCALAAAPTVTRGSSRSQRQGADIDFNFDNANFVCAADSLGGAPLAEFGSVRLNDGTALPLRLPAALVTDLRRSSHGLAKDPAEAIAAAERAVVEARTLADSLGVLARQARDADGLAGLEELKATLEKLRAAGAAGAQTSAAPN